MLRTVYKATCEQSNTSAGHLQYVQAVCTSYMRCCIGCSLSQTIRSFLCGRGVGAGAAAPFVLVSPAALLQHPHSFSDISGGSLQGSHPDGTPPGQPSVAPHLGTAFSASSFVRRRKYGAIVARSCAATPAPTYGMRIVMSCASAIHTLWAFGQVGSKRLPHARVLLRSCRCPSQSASHTCV